MCSSDLAQDARLSEAVLDDEAPTPAVVAPMAQPSMRSVLAPPTDVYPSTLEHLLHQAAARGATTLYVVSGAVPAVRVEDEVKPLDSVGILEPAEVDALLLSLPAEPGDFLDGRLAPDEWTLELPEVGRVRGRSFRDHRGQGCVVRLMPRRVLTSQELGLSRELQALMLESDGLVVITGPRLSGKRTVMAAFVDQINRTRHAHVVTIEREISALHAQAGSVTSQREVRNPDGMADAVRQALREDPDVVVVDDVQSSEVLEVLLDAAASGRLVLCGIAARGASAALDRLLELVPSAERRRVQSLLARNLRAVVAQVLLRKPGGGRLVARELMLNTPAVAALLADGRVSQLPMALEGGRRQGMVPLNDALASLVQAGAVDVAEATRVASDRNALRTLLQRLGIDVSSLEKRA